jgi:Ni/Co efflux regulator RcnB
MRKLGIMAGAATIALAAGAQAQAPMPAPAAGASYGASAPAGPGYSAWAGSPNMDHGHRGPRGYRSYQRGSRMGGIWRDPTYAVNDWGAWGLGQPGPGMHWVRYYDDAVLVDSYGTVVDSRHGVNWDGPRTGPVQGYAGGPGYPGPGYGGPGYGGPGWQGGPGTTVTRVGPNTTVTTQVVGAGGYGGGYPIGPGYVTIIPGSVITTTTTTSDETVYRNIYHRRVYRRPVRHYRPRCVQAPTCPVTGS